ncbi:MAG: hypothetical protein NTX26_01915 [Candidatus Parcubacteria bacterium]|nr:hypothetical protein [Candidatus Parcubacteria bacterium]
MIILLVLVAILWIALGETMISTNKQAGSRFGYCCLILAGILVISIFIGMDLPMGPAAEKHQLLGIQNGEKVYYLITDIVTNADSVSLPNTVFIIKDGDSISKQVLDGKSIIHYNKTVSPEVVFHRSYVQSKNLRILFFTHKGPTWYEFTIPDPSNIQQNL